MTSLVLVGLVVVIAIPVILAGILNTYYGARYRLPFVPSTQSAIQAMLELGEVRNGSVLLDLGSGAGDILIAAARQGATAVGIEINPFLVWWTRLKVHMLGLSALVTVIRADIFTTPLPQADVVTMYLPSKHIEKLKSGLATLSKETRIISHGYEMPGWKRSAGTADIHVYRLADLS